MASHKLKILALSLGIGVAATTPATILFFYYRNILYNLKIENKIDLETKKIKKIPFSAYEFEKEWNEQALKLNSPVFEEYFDLITNHKDLKNQLNNATISLISVDLNEIKFKITLQRTFGKTISKEFTIRGFKEIDKAEEIKKIYDFADKLKAEIDVLDKNKFASEVKTSDLTSPSLPNWRDYIIEYTLNPNDKTGQLKLKAKISLKKEPSITTSFEKTIIGFKLDQLDPLATLGFMPKSEVNGLKDVNTIKQAVDNVSDKKTKLKEYGLFDETNLRGANYTVTKLELIAANNIEQLKLTYELTKKVIVGRDEKGNDILEDNTPLVKTITISFTNAIKATYKKLMQAHLASISAKIASHEGYNHNKLASQFVENDWKIAPLGDKNEYGVTLTNIQTSDVERKVKLTYTIETKKLSTGNNVKFTKEYTLDGFNEDVPKNVASFTRKESAEVSALNFNNFYYRNNSKSLELVTASYDGASDGWQLDQSSIIATSLENNIIKFSYKLYKSVKTFSGIKEITKDFEISIDFEGIVDKNTEKERILQVYYNNGFNISYEGAKPMIDKVNIDKFKLDNKSDWKYYRVSFDEHLVNYNYLQGYLFVKANIRDKKNDSNLCVTNDTKIDGFKPYDYEGNNPIKQWNNFSSLITNDDKLYSTNFVISKYFKTLTSEGIINSLKSILKNNGEFDPTFNYEFLKGENNTFINEYSSGTLTFLKLKIKRDIPAATSYFDTTKSEWAKEISPTLDFVSLFRNNLERNYQSIFSALTIDANKFLTLNSSSFASNMTYNSISDSMNFGDVQLSPSNYYSTLKYEWELYPNDYTGKLIYRFRFKPGYNSNKPFTDWKQFNLEVGYKYVPTHKYNVTTTMSIHKDADAYQLGLDLLKLKNQTISVSDLSTKYKIRTNIYAPGNYEKESNWYTWPNLTFTIIDAENYLDADNKWQIRIKFKFRHRVYNYNGIQSGKHYGIGESNEISTEIYRHND